MTNENLTDINLVFFQNEGIFFQLDELDELDKINHAWIRIHLQFYTRTEDSITFVAQQMESKETCYV